MNLTLSSIVPFQFRTKIYKCFHISKQTDFAFKDLLETGIKAGINNPGEIIEKTVEIISDWKEYAKDCGVKDVHAKQIESNLLLLNKFNAVEEGIEM